MDSASYPADARLTVATWLSRPAEDVARQSPLVGVVILRASTEAFRFYWPGCTEKDALISTFRALGWEHLNCDRRLRQAAEQASRKRAISDPCAEGRTAEVSRTASPLASVALWVVQSRPPEERRCQRRCAHHGSGLPQSLFPKAERQVVSNTVFGLHSAYEDSSYATFRQKIAKVRLLKYATRTFGYDRLAGKR
jgi:hypothetical protein